MPKIRYIEHKFDASSLALIATCNKIIDEYTAQGYQLTLRQLYYQLVSRDVIANKQSEYKRLGSIVNDARLAGLIDWDSIEDRTRNLRGLAHWATPEDLVRSCAAQFRIDMWASQRYRPEVWIEKDALVGVIERVCSEFDVPYFSCRGYTSQSEMWGAGQRLIRYQNNNQIPFILHFGDHDPSGQDMTRDIKDRLAMFTGGEVDLTRLALNMNQIEKYRPPPNPAKTTDSRYAAYIAEYGTESWELDALEPRVLEGLVRKAVENLLDDEEWDRNEEYAKAQRETFKKIATNWEKVQRSL